MNIITISREFGSGGRELGKRIADILGFDYYDREIVSAIAARQHLDENYIENVLSNHGWQDIPLTYRRTFAAPSALRTEHVNLLLEEKRVIEGIAKAGKDCVIVGRNADVLLGEEKPFSIFVCAQTDVKVRRCIQRAEGRETLSYKEAEQKIKHIDKNRARTRALLTNSVWGQRDAYQLIVNTTDWEIRELAPAVADYAKSYFRRTK
ncbi:MAG: cytidylate kinase-like family protein [Clostridia bacterium]|nr:cytidylate kinase-like family protein [Clostridia bacterium]